MTVMCRKVLAILHIMHVHLPHSVVHSSIHVLQPSLGLQEYYHRTAIVSHVPSPSHPSIRHLQY